MKNLRMDGMGSISTAFALLTALFLSSCAHNMDDSNALVELDVMERADQEDQFGAIDVADVTEVEQEQSESSGNLPIEEDTPITVADVVGVDESYEENAEINELFAEFEPEYVEETTDAVAYTNQGLLAAPKELEAKTAEKPEQPKAKKPVRVAATAVEKAPSDPVYTGTEQNIPAGTVFSGLSPDAEALETLKENDASAQLAAMNVPEFDKKATKQAGAGISGFIRHNWLFVASVLAVAAAALLFLVVLPKRNSSNF